MYLTNAVCHQQLDTKEAGLPLKEKALSYGSWQRQTVLGLVPLLFGIELLVAVVFVPAALKGNCDFRQLYSGAYMLRVGRRHLLYDLELQLQTENQVVSKFSQVLPVNHPAFEYALLSPMTLLSYPHAYWVWLAFNFALLSCCYVLIARFSDKWLALAMILGFEPIAATLMHGQDSILLLLLFLLAYGKTDTPAGFLIGLGSFKPHIVLPIAAIYCIWQRWRFLRGFLFSSVPLGILSVWLVGVPGTLMYIRIASATTHVRHGPPSNLHGVIETLSGADTSFVLITSLVLSVGFFWFASYLKPSLETAIMLLPLITPYLMLHDMTVLLLPVALGISRGTRYFLQFLFPAAGWIPKYAFLAPLPAVSTVLMAEREVDSLNGATSPR